MKISALFFGSLILILSMTAAGNCETAEFDTNPIRAQAHKIHGDHYLKTGRLELAIREYEKAMSFSSPSTALYFNAAVAYYTAGDREKAIQALEKLVELNPEDVEAQYNLACLYLYKKNLLRAKSHLALAEICCQGSDKFLKLIQNCTAFIARLEELAPMGRRLVLSLFQENLPAISP